MNTKATRPVDRAGNPIVDGTYWAKGWGAAHQQEALARVEGDRVYMDGTVFESLSFDDPRS